MKKYFLYLLAFASTAFVHAEGKTSPSLHVEVSAIVPAVGIEIHRGGCSPCVSYPTAILVPRGCCYQSLPVRKAGCCRKKRRRTCCPPPRHSGFVLLIQ